MSPHRAARARARLTPLAVCAVVCTLTGCAVYDSSMLSDMGSPLDNGGEAALGGLGESGSGPGGARADGGNGSGADAAIPEDAGAAGDTSGGGDTSAAAAGSDAGGKTGTAQGGAAEGGAAQAGAAHGGTAQGGAAQAGSAQAGAAQAGSAQAGAPGSAGASGSGTPHDLSTGKPATASTQQTGNEVEKGNDGNYSTRWCGSTDSLPQWWRVDLGATHQLSSFSVAFQVATRAYTYDIETSPDDNLYTRRATITGTGAVQSSDFPAGISARYVRITVTHADPLASGASVWGSFYEFSVTGL